MVLKAHQQQQHETCLLVSVFHSETRVWNPESGGREEKRGVRHRVHTPRDNCIRVKEWAPHPGQSAFWDHLIMLCTPVLWGQCSCKDKRCWAERPMFLFPPRFIYFQMSKISCRIFEEWSKAEAGLSLLCALPESVSGPKLVFHAPPSCARASNCPEDLSNPWPWCPSDPLCMGWAA